jgi:phenylacetate-CoA ligase
MGPGVAQECVETKDGLHVWEDHFYPEVVDPLTDRPVADGEIGELVFTSLTKAAMPVVRYRTRDLTRLLPGTARPGMRRMEKVTGRTDDLMIVRGVNVFPTQVEELVLAVPGLSPYFQCVLTRPGRLDELEIVAEAEEGVPDASYPDLARRLAGRVKERIGVTAAVRVVAPGAIERSVGKARRILDHR